MTDCNTFAELLKCINDGENDLNLVAEWLTLPEVQQLSGVLKTNTTLEYLMLWINNIGAQGAKEIAEALKVNKSLQSLALGANDIGDEGANELAEALKVNKSLVSLFLFENHIGAQGAKELAEALKVNKSLQSLNLSSNNIGPEGAKEIAEALKVNKALKSLYLYGNNIGDNGAKDMAEALKENKSLQSLDLYNNNIRPEGAKALGKVIRANKRILYASYDNQSKKVEEELKKRRQFIQELITKWKTNDHNTFTEYELALFYNNLDSIRFISEEKTEDYSIDITQFHAEVCSRIYVKWCIKQALVSGFQQVYEHINPDKNLIESIVSIWTTVGKLDEAKLKSEKDVEREKVEALERERVEALEREKVEALERERAEAELKRQEQLRKALLYKVSAVALGVATFTTSFLILTALSNYSNFTNILLTPGVRVALSIPLSTTVVAKYIHHAEEMGYYR